MTLPKVNRSGAPAAYPCSPASRPNHPASLHRKPVITSSEMSSAPWAAVIRRSPSVKPGAGGTTPMLPGDASVISAAISLPRSAKAASTRVEVVERQHDRLGRHLLGDPGRVGQRERRDTRTRLRQQGVDVAVVAAGELHDERPAGVATSQADGAHRRLGAAGDQAHLLDGSDPADDLLAEGDLVLRRRAEREALGRGGGTASLDRGVPVAEDHRPPRADQVDVLATVGVGEVGPLRRTP